VGLLLGLAHAVQSLNQTLELAEAKKLGWCSCEAALGKARAALATWLKTSGDATAAEQVSQRLAGVGELLDRKAGVFDLIAELGSSVRAADVPALVGLLARAEKAKLDRRVHVQDLLAQARDIVDRFAGIHAQLVGVLSGTERVPGKLWDAACAALRVPVLPDSVDQALAADCERLVREAKSLAGGIARALEDVPERDAMRALERRVCQEHGLGGMPELAEVRRLLGLSEEKYVHEMLRAATRSGDAGRRVGLMIRLRELHLQTNGKQFKPDTYPDLRDWKEWSGGRRRFLLGGSSPGSWLGLGAELTGVAVQDGRGSAWSRWRGPPCRWVPGP
jgi:hypothetical protein